jgi:hypothetical protein
MTKSKTRALRPIGGGTIATGEARKPDADGKKATEGLFIVLTHCP